MNYICQDCNHTDFYHTDVDHCTECDGLMYEAFVRYETINILLAKIKAAGQQVTAEMLIDVAPFIGICFSLIEERWIEKLLKEDADAKAALQAIMTMPTVEAEYTRN